MAFGLFSGIADAISPSKLNRISYSPALDQQLNELTADQTGNRAAQAAQAGLYTNAANAAASEVAKLSPGDQAILQQIINARVDPYQTYQNVGNYNFGLLDRLSGNLAGLGQAGDSRAQAALGYGGRGGSTYQSNTLLDRISKNLSPVYASTLNNIGRDASAISGNQIAQNQNTLGLLDYRAGIPGRGLSYLAAPIQLNQSLTDSEIQQLLGLGTGYKTNTAGFQEKKSPLGSIAGGLDSAVDTGISAYTSGLFGGTTKAGAGSAPASGYSGGVNFGPSGYGSFGVNYGSNPGYSTSPANPSFGPSGYSNYGVGYAPGAWKPSWN